VKLQHESIDITTRKYAMKAVENPLEYGTFLKVGQEN
jgi:hypothetical protein